MSDGTNNITWLQARAHVLLKGKEVELRAAREASAAEPDHAAALAAAEAAAADACRERDQVLFPGLVNESVFQII